jgi:hypothetical protein
VKQLSFQNRAVRNEYEDVKRHNETLKSLVARYQKELKDQSRSVPGAPAPAVSSVNPPPVGEGAPQATKAAPPMSSSMNVNKASAADLVLVLGLPKDMADRIVTNRPYRWCRRTPSTRSRSVSASVPNRNRSLASLTGRLPIGGRPVCFCRRGCRMFQSGDSLQPS